MLRVIWTKLVAVDERAVLGLGVVMVMAMVMVVVVGNVVVVRRLVEGRTIECINRAINWD
jgi:hypothetical protein